MRVLQAAELAERQRLEQLKLALAKAERKKNKEEAQRLAADLKERERKAAEEKARAEAKRKAEEEEARRVAAELAEARRRAEELARELRRQREVAERAARIRAALAATGRCCQGYAWCREGGGFRCAGGSHTASFAEIARASGLSVEEVSGH